MFTIYTKEIGGRAFARYYKNWENARKELESELEIYVSMGFQIKHKIDRMNTGKGFYELEVTGTTCDGEDFALYLSEGYFQD